MLKSITMAASNGKIISRIAPTPSGYLHLGNARNFLLTWWIVRRAKGELWLRIDDADSARRKDEFIRDIFKSLEWLGIDWDRGPKNLEDFLANHSQTLKKKIYRDFLNRADGLYACDCSRKQIKERAGTAAYDSYCRERDLPARRGKTAIRLVCDEPGLTDFIVWRKDDIPAYHLTNVFDDIEAKTNLIIRGEDLRQAGLEQMALAKRLGGEDFQSIRFIHHPLRLGSGGKKLSKSQERGLSDIHLKYLRERGDSPRALLKEFASGHGLDPNQINAARDLLNYRPPYL